MNANFARLSDDDKVQVVKTDDDSLADKKKRHGGQFSEYRVLRLQLTMNNIPPRGHRESIDVECEPPSFLINILPRPTDQQVQDEEVHVGLHFYCAWPRREARRESGPELAGPNWRGEKRSLVKCAPLVATAAQKHHHHHRRS